MKENRKILLISAITALIISGLAVGILYPLLNRGETIQIEHVNGTPASNAMYTMNEDGDLVPLDFTKIAEDVKDAVVHIKSAQAVRSRGRMPQRQLPDLFRYFFEDQLGPEQFEQRSPRSQREPQVRIGTGSGVIISEDGYIVTNNHVIANADDIEVTLADNRNFKANVIGTDPSTDLALLQIKADGLPTLPFYNSDNVKVGEWVLAVGNPFNLTSTVTAGIVSAKGRNINIVQDQFAIESFIQTDAAINPGNSGGALVNLQGALIGVNTAIASPTGAYSGYGFAVPSDIVSKVVEDLIEYGVVQRGVLGVMIRTVDGSFATEQGLEVTNGAYVDSLLTNSAAGAAGIEKGDVIIAIDGTETNSTAQVQEQIARRRPGDQVTVTVMRDGKEREFTVTLKNRQGSTDLVTEDRSDLMSILGASMETLDSETARRLGIEGGVRVTELRAGKLRKYTQMREGFIITEVDGQRVTSVEELTEILAEKSGGVLLEGIYENIPGEQYYAFGM